MKINRIVFSLNAFGEYKSWEKEDKETLKRINDLLKDITRNNYEGIGKPELLKGDFSGFYSRRIDEKNRLIYRVEGDVIFVIACKTHYQDK